MLDFSAMNDFRDEGGGGLFSGLKGLVVNLLATGKTRLELLGNELEEEKLRAVDLAVMALGMVFCLGMFLLLAVVFLAVLYWDNRLVVLGAVVGFFFLLGVYFLSQLKRLMRRPQPMFAASIAELQEDIRQLKAAAGHES